MHKLNTAARSLAIRLFVPAAALVCFVTLAHGGSQSRPSSSPADTSSGVNISIGSHGVDIEAPRHRRHVRVGAGTVDISGTQIEIDSDSSGRPGHHVSVHGPVVIVDNGEAGIVRVFADADVPAGQRIEGDVVAVFGSVRVAGSVSGNVAAVLGSVKLEPGAVVDGDCVAVGGRLDQATGAVVNGESVSLGLFSPSPDVPTLPMLLGIIFASWLISLLFGGFLMLVFPNRFQRVAHTAVQRTAGSFVLGLASAPLVVIGAVLLCITVVGIPVALLLPLAYLLSIWAGQLATTYVLGCRLSRTSPSHGVRFLPILLGNTFVGLFFALAAILAGPQGMSRTIALFSALLATLLVLGLSIVGTGAVLLSRFGTRPRDLPAEPGAPMTAVPAPPAQPPPAPLPPPSPMTSPGAPAA